MFCRKCGSSNDSDATFCNSCGAPIKENSGQDNIDLAILWYNRGIEFSKSKEYEKELLSYNQAIFYNDKDPDFWNNKCDVLNTLKRYDEAVQAGKVAVQLSPEDPDYWDTLCDAYIGTNDREKADECQKNAFNLRKNKKETKKSEISSDEAWNEINVLAKSSIVIILVLALIGYILNADLFHIFLLFLAVLIGYFWTGPFNFDIAKGHNRNINWAYFIGFVLSFPGWFLYWVYVKLTNDPED
jgi:tetratricopeptide (TPR) repeat protein